MFEEVASAFVERRAFEAALAETEMHRAANAALESQLGQAHADLLLAQADAETLAVAVRAWASTHQPMECEECEDLVTLARDAHPGTPLADEVAAVRADAPVKAAIIALFRRIDYGGMPDGELLTRLLIELDPWFPDELRTPEELEKKKARAGKE